jgi:hypothetical protein
LPSPNRPAHFLSRQSVLPAQPAGDPFTCCESTPDGGPARGVRAGGWDQRRAPVSLHGNAVGKSGRGIVTRMRGDEIFGRNIKTLGDETPLRARKARLRRSERQRAEIEPGRRSRRPQNQRLRSCARPRRRTVRLGLRFAAADSAPRLLEATNHGWPPHDELEKAYRGDPLEVVAAADLGFRGLLFRVCARAISRHCPAACLRRSTPATAAVRAQVGPP